jgi:hypothetical protein
MQHSQPSQPVDPRHHYAFRGLQEGMQILSGPQEAFQTEASEQLSQSCSGARGQGGIQQDQRNHPTGTTALLLMQAKLCDGQEKGCTA